MVLDPVLTLAIFLFVTLAVAAPGVRAPIGAALALYVLTSEAPLVAAAVVGSAATMLGRLALALQGRAGRAGAKANQANQVALRGWLANNPSYARTTFLAGAAPVMPARVVFPLLGALRFPLRWALLGSLFGQVPVLLLTTWVALAVARALTGDDEGAVTLLATFVGVVVVLRFARGPQEPRWAMGGQLGGAAGGSPFAVFGGLPDVEGPAGRAGQVDDDDEDVIDLEAEDVVEEGDDDAPRSPGSLGPGSSSRRT